jgi:hypothetical protein
MWFDLMSGAFKCNLCEYGYSFSGIGSIKNDGYSVIFFANTDAYNMTAYVNVYDQAAKCLIEVYEKPGVPLFQEALSDSNLSDSIATCNPVKLLQAPLVVPKAVILQSEADGTYLQISPATGDYTFYHCEDGATMSGVGKVTWTGTWFNFEDITAAYRVMAVADMATHEGKAAIEVFEPFEKMPPMQEIISDNNMMDSLTSCGEKK